MIDLLCDRLQFFADGAVKLVCEVEIIRFFTEANDFFCQCDTAFSAFAPDFTESYVDAQLSALVFHQFQLCFRIGREPVDRYHSRKPEALRDVFHMLQKIRQAFFQC